MFLSVMVGEVPAIHEHKRQMNHVDARNKYGHEGRGR
jgi:hypothetical protein